MMTHACGRLWWRSIQACLHSNIHRPMTSSHLPPLVYISSAEARHASSGVVTLAYCKQIQIEQGCRSVYQTVHNKEQKHTYCCWQKKNISLLVTAAAVTFGVVGTWFLILLSVPNLPLASPPILNMFTVAQCSRQISTNLAFKSCD